MIRQLNVALVNMKVYAPDHPTASGSLQRSYDALKKILEQKAELALGVVENTLIVDESPVEESDSLVVKFIEELKSRNIEGIVFYTDIAQEEFKTFLDCLSQEPEQLIDEGGAQKFFERKGVSHILANEVKYGRIKDSIGDGEGLEEAIIAAFLMGKMPVFQGDKKGFLSLLEEDPTKISEMINSTFSKMKDDGRDEEDLSRSANRAVEQVGRFLEAQPEASANYTSIMAQIIGSLDPDAQAGVYRFRATQEECPHDRIDSLVTDFEDEEVVCLICNVYRGGLTSPRILARVATRVLPDLERRQKIAPKLGQELGKLGMAQEEWEGLRDDILWDTYSLSQKVDRLTSRRQLNMSDLERIKSLGSAAAEEKDGKDIRKLLKTLFSALKGEDAEVRENVARYLPQFYGLVVDSGKFKGADLFFCQRLIARLKGEADEKAKESILRSLATILEKETLQGRFNTPARAILTLSKKGYVEQLLKSSGCVVCEDVLLESILFDLEREENPDCRRRLTSIIESMGPGVTKHVIKRLADTRWYAVQSALHILGEMGEKAVSPDLLTSSVNHDDMRVRKEAIKTLGKVKGRGAIRMLCDLLEDRNEEIRLLVLKVLGEAGDNMAVPRILPFVQKKRVRGQKSDTLRRSAIEALGRIGDRKVIPALLEILRSKGLFRKEDETIRKSVVEALGALGDPELEGVLQSVVEKDTDGDVREAARMALLNLGTTERRAAI
jgi:HEAT repeat protein